MAHDFPGEPHMACGDLPVSTPEHLGTNGPFLLTLPRLFTEARHEKCNRGRRHSVSRGPGKSPEPTWCSTSVCATPP